MLGASRQRVAKPRSPEKKQRGGLGTGRPCSPRGAPPGRERCALRVWSFSFHRASQGHPNPGRGLLPECQLVIFRAAELMPEGAVFKTDSRDPECVTSDALWCLPGPTRRPPTQAGRVGAPVTMRAPRLCPRRLATRPAGV